MKFGSCPEFIGDCYSYDDLVPPNLTPENVNSCEPDLELKMAAVKLNFTDQMNANIGFNRTSQRGSNASTDITCWSGETYQKVPCHEIFKRQFNTQTSQLDEEEYEEENQDQFTQQEKRRHTTSELSNSNVQQFIGAGHYSGFSGQCYDDYEEENADNEDGTNFQNDFNIKSTDVLMEEMTNTLDTLNISNIEGLNNFPQSNLEDLNILLQIWCLEGPFPPDLALQLDNGRQISINSTIRCSLEEWNHLAFKKKVELSLDPAKQALVVNCPMKRYYGDLYPNNGRDSANSANLQKNHLFT